MNFKCRLKVIFAERDLHHGEFAKKVDISAGALSALVNNKSLPSFPVAYRISKELELDIKKIWIITEEKDDKR